MDNGSYFWTDSERAVIVFKVNGKPITLTQNKLTEVQINTLVLNKTGNQ